jgi:hypothetical protein
MIDGIDTAIVSNISKVKVKQYVLPVLNTVTRYETKFTNAIYNPHEGHMPGGWGVARSNGFFQFGNTETTYYLQDDGKGNIVLYHKEIGTTTITTDDGKFGSIDYVEGTIIIPVLNISGFSGTDENLEWTVELDSNDVVPVRNQIIQIESSSITASEDTIASGTYSGNVNYTTTPSRY